MIHDFETSALAMRAGELQRITGAAGSTVRIETGTVWVTQDGVRKDLVLGPGEAVRIETEGLVLLQAFAPALVSLGAQAASGGPAEAQGGRRTGNAVQPARVPVRESAIAAISAAAAAAGTAIGAAGTAIGAAGTAIGAAAAGLQPPSWQQARAAQALVAATRRMFASPPDGCAGC